MRALACYKQNSRHTTDTNDKLNIVESMRPEREKKVKWSAKTTTATYNDNVHGQRMAANGDRARNEKGKHNKMQDATNHFCSI